MCISNLVCITMSEPCPRLPRSGGVIHRFHYSDRCMLETIFIVGETGEATVRHLHFFKSIQNITWSSAIASSFISWVSLYQHESRCCLLPIVSLTAMVVRPMQP